MRDYLHEYQVELTTVGPVFIGSGKELNKKEYILKEDSILVIDISKLYGFMAKKGMGRDFEDFFLYESKAELSRWLKGHRIRIYDIRPCIKYEISQSDTALEKGTRQVMEFVKDPYGAPYIPGSSIKGMLRTVLLNSLLLSEDSQDNANMGRLRNAIKRGGNKRTYLLREQKDIEAAVFNTLNRPDTKPLDAVNDVLSGLRISDSEPIDIKDMVLCQRIEYHPDGEEKKLNVLRECIKPDTAIRFSLTIDSGICPYSKDDICKSISAFSSHYDKFFRCKFRGMHPGMDNTVYLGGGVGFVSKTDISAIFDEKEAIESTIEIFDNTKVPFQHKHHRDKGLGVSPHILKASRVKGRLYHMGECLWRFI